MRYRFNGLIGKSARLMATVTDPWPDSGPRGMVRPAIAQGFKTLTAKNR
jgi:hypothetical protein